MAFQQSVGWRGELLRAALLEKVGYLYRTTAVYGSGKFGLADRFRINCINDTVRFVDHSAVRLSSASWLWSFPGGDPSSSTQENPIVVYSQPGTYDVSLTVSDAFGTSSQSYTDFINYTDSVSLITNTSNFTQDFENSNFPPSAWELESLSFSWLSTNVDFGIDCLPTTVAYVDHYWFQSDDEAVSYTHLTLPTKA